jgi:hypothetical protein
MFLTIALIILVVWLLSEVSSQGRGRPPRGRLTGAREQFNELADRLRRLESQTVWSGPAAAVVTPPPVVAPPPVIVPPDACCARGRPTPSRAPEPPPVVAPPSRLNRLGGCRDRPATRTSPGKWSSARAG